MNVLCIVDQNHQRSVILVDIVGILKAFSRWSLKGRNIYPERGNYCSKLKKRKVGN